MIEVYIFIEACIKKRVHIVLYLPVKIERIRQTAEIKMTAVQESSIFFIPGMPGKIKIVFRVESRFLHPVLSILQINSNSLAVLFCIVFKHAVIFYSAIFKIPQAVKNEV